MSTIKGVLVFESPVYRGNASKTIFTRGNSSDEITLPGKLDGSAKAMMSAFTGFWQNHRNPNFNNHGLLEKLWQRLYGESMPRFVNKVDCTLDKKITEGAPYFDLKMGIALDRDRMTQAADQNYRLESVYRGSNFNFSLDFNDNNLDNIKKYKFAYLMEELIQGRFWFGALKSKGMGKCRLELDTPSQNLLEGYKKLSTPNLSLNSESNYIFIELNIVPENPLLVSWPWGTPDNNGVLDSWVDDLASDVKDHRKIMEKVVSGQARDWNDVKKLDGGSKFESTHMRNGRPMDLNQIKSNFRKGIQNDDTLMAFLKGHKKRAHEEIHREPHIDFREEKRTVTRGKPYDQLFNRSLKWDGDKTSWELCIPGSTIKGAFRIRAQQILRTLNNGRGCKEKTSSHRDRFCDDRHCPVCSLFGRQGMIAKASFSDAYLVTDDKLLDDEHCSYDQIAIDKKTGKSVDNSKMNFLYAYGDKFSFRCTLALQDVNNHDFKQLAFLMYLLREFDQGTIPIGGKKSLNFGFVRGSIENVRILCPSGSQMESLVKQWELKRTATEPVWNHYEIAGNALWKNSKFTDKMQSEFSNLIGNINVPKEPFKTGRLISHRQYSKLCGFLECELEAITPLHVKESGEPTFQSDKALGYDFFSISPPKNNHKPEMSNREYAIPPSTLKGMTRHIYNLISRNPCRGCKDIDSICDTCSLFGFSSDQGGDSLMGRLSFSFARPLDTPGFEWYGVQFGYKGEKSFPVAGNRIFPHSNNSNQAVTRHGVENTPQHVVNNITLNRYARPGSKFLFNVGFINLEESELKKLIWALELEKGLGHKIGKSKALQLGSCKITIRQAGLIDWKRRFSSLDELGLTNFDINKHRPSSSELANYNDLKRALILPR